MARILDPAHSAEVRGSIGGYTFNRGTKGNYCSTRIKPVDTRSTASQAYKSQIWNQAVFHWANNEPAFKLAWDQFAEKYPESSWCGTKKILTGREQFIRHWIVGFKYFGVNIFYPPPSNLIDFHPNFSISTIDSITHLSWGVALPANTAVIVYQSRPNKHYNTPSAKKVLAYILDTVSSSGDDISPEYNNGGGPGNLPPIISGTWLQNRIFTVDSFGRSSVRLELDFLCY